MPEPEEYINIQREYRKKFLRLQQQLEREYDKINRRLLARINQLSVEFAKSDGTFDRTQLKQIKREIDSLTNWFRTEAKDWLDNNIVKSAGIAINSQDKAAEYYIRSMIESSATAERRILQQALTDPADSILLKVKYGEGLLNEISTQVWRHRWDDGAALSDRIWNIHDLANSNLQHMAEQTVNEGESAVKFAKEAEKYLGQSGPKWTTAIKPAKTERGSVRYNSLRLARTETNQAYHRVQQIGDQESAIVKGTRWNLSSSHPDYPPSYQYRGYQEICDYRAKDDHHGLGNGVYPAGQTPFGHPNGLCYLTSVLYEGVELINVLKEKYS